MEEKKIKKKKLTLSAPSKTSHKSSNYIQTRGKTSVVIEKKSPKRWGERKPQSREGNFIKTNLKDYFTNKKSTLDRNFDIRKMAEARATKRFKSPKDENVQQKKISFGKEKNIQSKRAAK